jgi:hypothetical protein
MDFSDTEPMHQKHDRAYHRLYSEPALLEDQAREGRLSPAFPLRLYNGDDHWQAATDVSTLITSQYDAPLWSYQPGMRYYLINEKRYPQGKPVSLIGKRLRFGSPI